MLFKVKSKVVPVHTIKGYRQSGGRVPLILNFGTRWRWMVSHTPNCGFTL